LLPGAKSIPPLSPIKQPGFLVIITSRTGKFSFLAVRRAASDATAQENTLKKNAAVQVVSSELIFKGRVMEIFRDQIVEPSGIKATREWVKHPGSVVVLPIFPDGRILLIRQYRYAAAQEMWELVAGHKEPDEDFVTGAHRELEEESGYTAKKMKRLLEFYPSPGFLGEKMVVFLAEGLTKGVSNPEDDEKIAARIVPLAQAEDWIRTGKIRDAKTVCGILYYSKFMRGKTAKPKKKK
jgi:ADP-ribose diphosphatase